MLNEWVQQIAALCQPDSIHLVTGSDEEARMIEQELVASKTFIPLNPEKRPNSFLARSAPDDVARVEDRTFICCSKQEDAGPTNNWKDPVEMKGILNGLFTGCMKGRTMYVVPFCMGPLGSPYSHCAVQITDSPYVVANMRLMTRMGDQALKLLNEKAFVKCIHSVGMPEANVPWPCNTKNLYISHFPESEEIWSFGSGYGGNALLNKKSFALRIASTKARREGWLAEHMLILGITNPEGVKRYFAASFPSACGKTNLAMLTSTLKGWKVECVGDDIAWMYWADDGTLRAINPEAGFFGVAPGTSYDTNYNAMKSVEKNAIFTNVALTDDGDVWWEGMTKTPPEHAISWLGEDWTPASGTKAAHPNSRFTVSSTQCPILDPAWDAPSGLPISGIFFGGRRSSTIPLVRQALSWKHGVFMAAAMSSEMTAAAKGEVGKLRHDPFAMLPFCGYNMGDYFAHWLSMEQSGRKLPEIFYVNWFRKDASGKFLWPGFGENIRVLKWMFEAVEGKVNRVKTPIGYMPEALDLEGLHLAPGALEELLAVDKEGWKKEASDLASYFAQFGSKLPEDLKKETDNVTRAVL
ncbi:MAG: phosphoenolpyruvate carboxykinase (GTP) [Verrucomicrobia bacterium]|nr:phosphoenolpyruvate carboxykinase (GTP) [Verrucomicrobiota bacterium]MBS0637104.1 phosphoenolpyruvate carboxykinase (GTP) [Verrucomicrobiota bacterium]